MSHDQPPTASLSRRDFLGVFGLALLAPDPGDSNAAGGEAPVAGPEFHGCLADLVLQFPLAAAWEPEIDALVESLDAPQRWVLGEYSKLSMFCAGLSFAEMASRYRAAGVEKVCEGSCFSGAGDQRHGYFVELAIFLHTARCQNAWRGIDQFPEEAGLENGTGVGDAMVISRGGYCLPGKVYFRRGNVLASVLPVWTPQESAHEFAGRFDRWIVSCFG